MISVFCWLAYNSRPASTLKREVRTLLHSLFFFFSHASQSNIEWKRNLLYFNAIILEDFIFIGYNTYLIENDNDLQSWIDLDQILNEKRGLLHNNTWGVFPLIMCNKDLIINKNDLQSLFSTRLNQRLNDDWFAFIFQYNNFGGIFHMHSNNCLITNEIYLEFLFF